MQTAITMLEQQIREAAQAEREARGATKPQAQAVAGSAYTVTVPETPGALPTTRDAKNLRDARAMARFYDQRRDLKYSDVVIRRNGVHYEYAGPAR